MNSLCSTKDLVNIMKVEGKIPPSFLKSVGIPSFTIIKEKEHKSLIQLDTLLFEGNEKGSVYRCNLSPSPNETIEDLSKKMTLRLELRKSLFIPIFPMLIDFKIKEESNKISIITLTKSIGKSMMSSILDEVNNYTPSILNSYFYIIRYLLEFSRFGIIPKILGPEYIFINGNIGTIFDLKDVMENSLWTMEEISRWKTINPKDWSGSIFKIPEAFLKYANSTSTLLKLNIYILSASFFALISKSTFIDELNDIVSLINVPNLIEFMDEQVKKNYCGISWLDKFRLLLSCCIVNCPGLCPTLDELDYILTNFSKLSKKEIIGKLSNKCPNCGEKIEKFPAIVDCIDYLICNECASSKPCMLCRTKHYYNTNKTLILKKNNEETYKIMAEKMFIYPNGSGKLCILIVSNKIGNENNYCEIINNGENTIILITKDYKETCMTIINPIIINRQLKFVIGKIRFEIKEVNEKKLIIERDENKLLEITDTPYKIGKEYDNDFVISDAENHHAIISHENKDVWKLIPIEKNPYAFISYRITIELTPEVNFTASNNGIIKIGSIEYEIILNENSGYGYEWDETIKCSICKEGISNIVIKKCMHHICCRDCIKHFEACPVCDTKFSNSDEDLIEIKYN